MAIVLCERLAGIPAIVSGASLISQGTSIVAQAVLCTVEFTSAVALAWLWHAGPDAAIHVPAADIRPFLRAPAAIGLASVWIFSLANFQLQMGGSILTSGYNLLPTGSQVFFSGAWPVLANLSLLLLEISARRWSTLARMALNGLWVIQFLVFLAHGNRADLLAGLFILLLMRVHTFRRQWIVLIVGALLGIPFLTFLLAYRAYASRGATSLSAIISMSASGLQDLSSFGDVGDAAITTTAGVYMVESGRRPFADGHSYLDYVVDLIPSALRGGFAVTGASYYNEVGMGTVGGMTPVSEAYFNFAWWGCLLVGLVHGWLIAWLHRRRLRTPSPLWVGIYAAAVAYSFRCYFYGPADLVKVEFVLLLFFAAVGALNAVGRRATLPSRSAAAAAH